MEFEIAINEILYLVLTGVVPLLIAYVIGFLKIKIKEQTASLDNKQTADYINIAVEVIEQVVIEVNQTFVDELKRNGRFTKESANEAKELAVQRCKQLISEKSKQAIDELYNDFDAYLSSKIEELVRINKEK